MTDVFHGQPVLLQLGSSQAEDFGGTARNFPQSAMRIEQKPRGRMCIPCRDSERLLYIPEIVGQIRGNDEVELFVEIEGVDVGLDELEFRVPFPSQFHHRRRKVDTHPTGRLQRGQKVSGTTAKLKDAHARRNHEAEDLRQTLLIVAAGPFPALERTSEIVPIGRPLNCILSPTINEGLALSRAYRFLHWIPVDRIFDRSPL